MSLGYESNKYETFCLEITVVDKPVCNVRVTRTPPPLFFTISVSQLPVEATSGKAVCVANGHYCHVKFLVHRHY